MRHSGTPGLVGASDPRRGAGAPRRATAPQPPAGGRPVPVPGSPGWSGIGMSADTGDRAVPGAMGASPPSWGGENHVEGGSMKAVVYEGPRKVSVKDVPDARIERPTDVLVRITSANICGSDLHMYEGRTDFEPGRWFGHENLGQVVEVGDGVDKVQVGEYVVLPFNISCGHCKNCERQLTNYCLTAQPEANMAGAAYGFADMGPYGGGQAELLRVPWGDFNCLRLGEDAEERQTDYVMLADIFPTGYHATEMAGVQPGDQTVIYGAGPVGLMAALSATIRGASKVMVVDRHPDRLRLAESIGAIAIDDSKVDPVQAVLDQ